MRCRRMSRMTRCRAPTLRGTPTPVELNRRGNGREIDAQFKEGVLETLLTLREASERLGLTRSRLFELATSGTVPCVDGAGGMLFRASELAALQRRVSR